METLGEREAMKTRRECQYTRELDLETLVWTRGPNFPLSSLWLARKQIQRAHIIAWSLWRRTHQAIAQRAHFKAKRQL